MKRYERPEDVHMRLHGSICMWENKPVWVHQHAKTMSVALTDVRTDQTVVEKMNPNDEALDISSVPLGYASSRGKIVAFTYRLPFRQQKQGVSGENSQHILETYSPEERRGNHPGLPVQGAELADLIEGKYPSIVQLENSLKSRKSLSGAFHRKFAITLDKQGVRPALLKFCSHTAGFYDLDGRVALLFPPFDTPAHRLLLRKCGIDSEVMNNVG